MTVRSTKYTHYQDQLIEVKQAFLNLLEAVPEDVWDIRLKGENWTIKEEIVHVVQVVKVISGGIKRVSIGRDRSLLYLVPRGLRSWINGNIIIPWKARGETRESIAADYQQAHDELISVLLKLNEDDWDKGMPFPREYRTVAQLAVRPVEHYREHEAHVRGLIKGWRST